MNFPRNSKAAPLPKVGQLVGERGDFLPQGKKSDWSSQTEIVCPSVGVGKADYRYLKVGLF